MLLQQGMSWLAAAIMLPATTAAANAWCVTGVGRGDVLPMRSGPGIFGSVTATIAPTACGIKIVGPCYGGWCPVSFRGRSGWSNSAYLVSQSGVASRRAHKSARVSRAAAPQKVAVAPQRSSPVREVERERAAEPARAAPVAAPAPKPTTPVEPTPEQRALTAGGREACVQGVPRGDTLKVRAAPSASADLRYGFLPDTCGVKITGDCKDGWCPVEYRGYKGWAEEKNLQ